MAKYCGKCGARLDESTGLCPNCHADQLSVPTEPVSEVPKKQVDVPKEFSHEQPQSKRELKKKTRAEKKSAKKNERKQCKANKKAEKKARKREKWAAKPWWKKILSILLRCIAWLLVMMIAAAGLTAALGHFGLIEIPVVEDVLITLGLTEQYHVTPPDADEYFDKNSTVIAISDANTSDDVQTEAQTCDILTERGFTEYPITSNYSMDGTYYDPTDISDASASKHPIYETYYVTKNGDVWTVIIINGSIMANPVSYNLQSNLGVQVIISETDTVTSYDSATNQFYETIPHDSELIVKTVNRIDAETLEVLTYGVIEGL